MTKSSARTIIYGLLALVSMLVSSLGYLYGHKLLVPAALLGVLTAVWQILLAGLILSLAGAIGERFLGSSIGAGLVRFALAAALGVIVLSALLLIVGTFIGTGFLVLVAMLAAVAGLTFRQMPIWWRNLGELRNSASSLYERLLALGVLFILAASLAIALAPPVEFDALVYHLSIPLAYLQQGRIAYLPTNMFWGMPELVEVLYVALIRLAAVESAAVFIWMVGVVALIGLFGLARPLFGDRAAWTAVTALVIGENLTRALSTAYVDWMSILFGVCTLAAFQSWLQDRKQRMLVLIGVFCGAALSTKYSAGILLLGILIAIIVFQLGKPVRGTAAAIILVGVAAALVSAPWWIRNFAATGNPFYPFFFPTGGMDANRLLFYQTVPPWQDWRAVILLPWQVTFWGIDGKDGFAASIGALLVGLSPLAWMGWRSKTAAQRQAIAAAAIIMLTAILFWAVGSRISGLLIQTRLYLAVFPAWAILACAGFASVQDIPATGIRFGRLIAALIVTMFGLALFALTARIVSLNPVSYVLRQEDEPGFLHRNMAGYASAMDAVAGLPPQSRVLMLWEPRGYYCEPRCDSDEVIDRWFDDSHLYGSAVAIREAWHSQGYTELLIFNLGRQFVQANDYPQDQKMRWSVLDATLQSLPLEKQIAGGSYTLYRIP